MTHWVAFTAATLGLTALLLAGTHHTQRFLDRASIAGEDGSLQDARDAAGAGSASGVVSSRALQLNAAASQLLALAALGVIAWLTAVPAVAFGVGGTTPAIGVVPNWMPSGLASAMATIVDPDLEMALFVGTLAGGLLYAGNEAAVWLGARVGLSPSVRLRRALAPTDAGGWALLLGVVLPVIAVFEEALFRGALIGALALGLAVDPWLLAVGSSVAFGLGHGAQGRLGVIVTAVLGFALAALFVLTGSLLIVVVAHYVVNALEFGIRDGIGLAPMAASD